MLYSVYLQNITFHFSLNIFSHIFFFSLWRFLYCCISLRLSSPFSSPPLLSFNFHRLSSCLLSLPFSPTHLIFFPLPPPTSNDTRSRRTSRQSHLLWLISQAISPAIITSPQLPESLITYLCVINYVPPEVRVIFLSSAINGPSLFLATVMEVFASFLWRYIFVLEY